MQEVLRKKSGLTVHGPIRDVGLHIFHHDITLIVQRCPRRHILPLIKKLLLPAEGHFYLRTLQFTGEDIISYWGKKQTQHIFSLAKTVQLLSKCGNGLLYKLLTPLMTLCTSQFPRKHKCTCTDFFESYNSHILAFLQLSPNF